MVYLTTIITIGTDAPSAVIVADHIIPTKLILVAVDVAGTTITTGTTETIATATIILVCFKIKNPKAFCFWLHIFFAMFKTEKIGQ